MRRCLLALATLAALAAPASAAVRTSTQSGNTNSTPFAFGSAVAAGDQLIIGHAVAVDSSVALGTSPPKAPTAAPTLTATTGGTLTNGGAAYKVVVTNVDSAARESAWGVEIPITLSGATNNAIAVSGLGSPPPGISSRNIYLTAANGAALSESLAVSGVTGASVTLTAPAAGAALPNGWAVQLTGGSLTVNAGVTLTLRGDTRQGNAPMTLAAGSTLTFDTGSATTPASTNYAWLQGTANTQAACTIAINGTSVAPCAVNATGGGFGSINGGQWQFGPWVDAGGVTATYCDFTGLGSAAIDAITSQGWSAATSSFTFANGIFSGCGRVAVSAPNGPATVAFTNCTFKSTLNATTPLAIGSSIAVTTGSRSVSGCNFNDASPPLTLVSAKGFAFDNNYFYNVPSLGSAAGPVVTNSLVRNQQPANTEFAALGDVTGNYFLSEQWKNGGAGTIGGAADLNPHLCGFSGAAGTVNCTGNVAEYTGNDGNGDCFLHFGASVTTLNLKNNLTLPNAAGDDSGTLMTIGADVAAQAVAVEHNTTFGGSQAPAVGEGSPQPHAGMLGSFKSNLIWTGNGFTYGSLGGFKLGNSGGYTSGTMGTSGADIVAPTSADYNCGWNTIAGFAGNGYNLNESAQPGTHDLNLSGGTGPNFVDSTRNFATWAASVGSTGTTRQKIDDGLLQLSKRNDRSGYNVAYSIPALRAWVRAGFVVRNPALNNAGHDGATIGAMGYQSASSLFRFSGAGRGRAGSRSSSN